MWYRRRSAQRFGVGHFEILDDGHAPVSSVVMVGVVPAGDTHGSVMRRASGTVFRASERQTPSREDAHKVINQEAGSPVAPRIFIMQESVWFLFVHGTGEHVSNAIGWELRCEETSWRLGATSESSATGTHVHAA